MTLASVFVRREINARLIDLQRASEIQVHRMHGNSGLSGTIKIGGFKNNYIFISMNDLLSAFNGNLRVCLTVTATGAGLFIFTVPFE